MCINVVFLHVFETSTNWLPLGWRTRDQLLQLYNQNYSVVDSIVEGKIQKGEYKEHPDCPGSEEAMLYYCLVDVARLEEDQTEEKIEISTNIDVELGSEAGVGSTTVFATSSVPSLKKGSL